MGCLWRPGSRLRYPQAWPSERRHVDRRIASGVHAQAHAHLRRCLAGSLSRDVSPQATPVDNLDDACLAATLQPTHALTPLVLSLKCD